MTTRAAPSPVPKCDARERGSLTLFTLVLAFALLAVAGLVLDGGTKLTAQRRADNQAEQAARAGAQAVDLGQLRASGEATLQAAGARVAAVRFLTATGYPVPTQHVVDGEAAWRLDQRRDLRAEWVCHAPTSAGGPSCSTLTPV
jgi:Flp pilus assembly protein TadG